MERHEQVFVLVDCVNAFRIVFHSDSNSDIETCKWLKDSYTVALYCESCHGEIVDKGAWHIHEKRDHS